MSGRMREKEIVTRAEIASTELLELIPPGSLVRRANAERIIGLCREFVQQRPSRRPTSLALAELGQVRFGSFPAEQTLLNHYRQFLVIWRKAYLELVSARAPRPESNGSLLALDALRHLDAGTRGLIDQMQILLKEQKRENDRLRTIIRQTVPVPIPGQPAVGAPAERLQLVNRWLSDLEKPNTALSIDEAGVRVTRLGHPGRIIMDVNVLESLRELTGYRPPTGRRGGQKGVASAEGFEPPT